MRNGNNILGDVDWSMILIYLIFVSLGLSNIYSSVYDPEHSFLFDMTTEHGKQSMWIGISIFLGFITLLLDGNFIIKNSYWVYGVTILLLVLVLFTTPIHGARSWFGFGSVGIQPAEFAKIGVSLALARYLSTNNILKKKRTNVLSFNLGSLVETIASAIQKNSRIL